MNKPNPVLPEHQFSVISQDIKRSHGFFVVEREFYGYKQITGRPKYDDYGNNINKYTSQYRIAKLLIPCGALVFAQRCAYHPYNLGKCRASIAEVIEITNAEKTRTYTEGYSLYQSNFRYWPGHSVIPLNHDTNDPIAFGHLSDNCGPGIHFYFEFDQAVNH